jgi:hypothetical protein
MAETITWEDLGTPAAPSEQPSVPVLPQESTPQAPGTVTFEELGTPPEGYVPKSVTEDLPPSIASGAAQGAMGVAGLPGAMTYYTREYVEKPIRRRIQGEQATEDWARSLEEGMTREERQRISEGSATPFQAPGGPYVLPTMQGMDIWGSENIPGYEYKPETKIGETLQTGTNIGVQSLIGGPKGLGRRFVSGVGAGAGVENLGQLGESISGETGKLFGEVTGAVIGDLITHKIIDFGSNIGFANAEAKKQLAEAISADIATDPAFRERLKAAVDSGEKIYLADFLQGSAARNLLGKNFSPRQQEAMFQINRELERRAANVQNVVDDKFAYIVGRNLRDVDFETSIKEANERQRDALYKSLKSTPEAQSVTSPALDVLSQRRFIAQAMNEVNKKLGDYPASWNVRGGTNPNLAYWDQVKRELQANVTTGLRSSDPSAVANVPLYQNAVKELTTELDKLVPAYGSTRNKAAELFGVETSLEGGYKLAQTLASGSPFKVGEFMKSYKTLRPSEKEAFAQGTARFMLQKSNGDMSKLIGYMENQNVKKTLSNVLGKDKFDAIYAKAVSANLMSNADNFAFTSSATSSKFGDLAKDVVGGIALTSPTIPASMASGNIGLKLAAGATVATGALAGIALNLSERRVANKVVELAFSKDPKDARAFAKLLADDYDAVSVVRKLGDYLHSGTQKAAIAYINNQREDAVPVQQNAGGRVARKSGGRIRMNPISAEVKRVRTLLSEKTASMLSVPDDAIATALHIAKRS